MSALSGKAILVTGAAGGIGAAAATLFASRGAKLVVADLKQEGAEATAAAINTAGGKATALRVDIADEKQVVAMVEGALKALGRIDVLYNNAGDLASAFHMRDANVETMEIDVWDNAFRVNTRGTMLCCKYVLAHMKAKGGSIINTASTMALRGTLRSPAYSASKAAIIQMTRAIAASHGKYGIRCNSIAPGMTLSEAVKSKTPDIHYKIMESETLLPDLTQPEDVARVAAFLASDDSANITGQNFVVDGGMLSAGGIGQMRNLAKGG